MQIGTSRRKSSAKLGTAVAIVFASLQLLGTEARAAPVVPSDTLQVGDLDPKRLFEGNEGPDHKISETVDFATPNVTGTRTIVLTEPGSQAISDIVTAEITRRDDCRGENCGRLKVTLTSDDDKTPLFLTHDFLSIAETGGVQDLTEDFIDAFDENCLPTILVSSDLDVPEPGTLSLLGAALFGLAMAGRRKAG